MERSFLCIYRVIFLVLLKCFKKYFIYSNYIYENSEYIGFKCIYNKLNEQMSD